MFLLSAELSARVKFSYPIYYRDENGQLQNLEFDESYIPCLNVMAGWKFLKSDGKLSRFGAFMRLYAGLNYHGQFRNIPLYPRASVTLVYEN